MRSVLRRFRRGDASPPGPSAADPLAGATPADRAILEQALPFTMTGVARMQALIDAVRYVVDRGLPGALAECGVWRGGSVLAMLLTLRDLGVSDRDVFLYDTFEGMTAPTEHDVSEHDPPALDTWRAAQVQGERAWPEMFAANVFSESGVRETVARAGYPAERIHFAKGPVEETLPGTLPGPLALLRLDTDWYESTRHELVHLYPLLVAGGVLIVDDYGHWQGAAQAVDEYFAAHPPAPLLQRIDYTGRLAVKA
jgi:O-methyltransferase